MEHHHFLFHFLGDPLNLYLCVFSSFFIFQKFFQVDFLHCCPLEFVRLWLKVYLYHHHCWNSHSLSLVLSLFSDDNVFLLELLKFCFSTALHWCSCTCPSCLGFRWVKSIKSHLLDRLGKIFWIPAEIISLIEGKRQIGKNKNQKK